MNESLVEAIKFKAMGISTIPISYRSKSPDGFRLSRTGDMATRKSRGGGVYKIPSWEKYQKEIPSYKTLRSWFSDGRAGLGVITGWQNLVVIDFDNIFSYKAWEKFAKLKRIPQTYKVKTRRGVHVYFFLKKPMSRTIKSPLGIDVKFTGYVLAPPSIHPSGFEYKMLSADNIKKVDDLEQVLPADIFKLNELNYSDISLRNGDSFPIGAWDDDHGLDFSVKKSVRILSFFPNARNTGGDFYMDLCPFHEDSSPSFWINDKLNRCGCHSCINGSYSSIDFYSKFKNLNLKDALREMSAI